MNMLLQMGDYLDGIERNGVGFNSHDKAAWQHVRGHEFAMARLLRKYCKTRLGDFDVSVIEATLAREPSSPPIITPTPNPRWGSLVMDYQGEMPYAHKSNFIDLQKKFGLWWDRETNRNYVPKKDLANFDFNQYRAAMEKIGFTVNEIAKAPKQQQQAVTASQAFASLDQKRGYNLFACRVVGDYFEFKFSYSTELNALFSNKTGKLTGIVEVDPRDWSRRTNSLELAEEAIEKAKAILPAAWTFVFEGIEEERARRTERNAKLTAPIPSVVEKLNPEFNLFPFQNEFVRFVEMSGGNCLIGAEMGLGKTIITLSWAAIKDKRILVVCPKVVRRTWTQEAKKFYPSVFNDFNSLELTPKSIKKYGLPDLSQIKLATVNFASLEKFLPSIEKAGFDLIVIDESHNIKSEHAKITKTVHSIGALFKHKILLSGTAIKNKKDELYTQVELIRPGFFESKQALKMAAIGGTWHDIQAFYKTKSKHEVLKDLPPKISQIVELEVDECPDYDINDGISFEDIAAMKANVAIAKAPCTIQYIEEILESSDSCILVFSDSVEVVEKIKDKLGDLAILHHGQLSDDVREKAKKDFQDGNTKARVLVSTRQSLAVGATLTRADRVVFNDLPWTPADIRQAEDRCHRIGQANSVHVTWIKAANNNWDDKVIGILKQKYDISKKILEGKQVTEIEREWMNKSLSVKDFAKRS